MIILKKGDWLDHFYQFSKPLILTIPFGAIFFMLSIPNQTERLPWMDNFMMSFIFWFLLVFVLLPIILLETIWLGVLINRTKGYGWFKSQCYSFAMFLLLPLVVPFLEHALFVMVFAIYQAVGKLV